MIQRVLSSFLLGMYYVYLFDVLFDYFKPMSNLTVTLLVIIHVIVLLLFQGRPPVPSYI